MKLNLSLLFSLLVAGANAFSAKPPGRAVRPDTSAAVEEALKVTAAFGINSNEARIAWETVEEMDSADNSAATKGSLVDECDVEEPSVECQDYGQFLDELKNLQAMMSETAEDKKKKSLVDVLKNVKLSKPEASKAQSSPQLTAALEEAKAMTAKHGITSKEARLAWESYEEIASSGLDNAMGVSLLEECSVEAGQDACKAIEELERVMSVLMAISK